MFGKLYKKIEELNESITKNRLLEVSELLGDKKELIKRNMLSGIFKGIGFGIGVTIITSIIVITLQKIVKLNIPVIGEYVKDIVEIVEKNR